MYALWLLYSIVSAADLTLTVMLLTPETEGNPIAQWIWSTFGFFGVFLFKVLIVSFVLLVCKTIHKKRPKTANNLLGFGIISTSITCLFFGATII